MSTENYKQMIATDLPQYNLTEKEYALVEMKRKSINNINYIPLLVSFTMILIIVLADNKVYAEPVWLSKTITFVFVGSMLIFSFYNLKNRVSRNCEIYGKRGFLEKYSQDKKNMLVTFPDIESEILCKEAFYGRFDNCGKDSKIFVFSFDGKKSYGVPLYFDKVKKRGSNIIIIFIFSFFLIDIIGTDVTTQKYEAEVLEFNYNGTEQRIGKDHEKYTVYVGEARVYAKELEKEVNVEIAERNKSSFPKKNDRIKIANTTGYWFVYDSELIFFIGFGSIVAFLIINDIYKFASRKKLEKISQL